MQINNRKSCTAGYTNSNLSVYHKINLPPSRYRLFTLKILSYRTWRRERKWITLISNGVTFINASSLYVAHFSYSHLLLTRFDGTCRWLSTYVGVLAYLPVRVSVYIRRFVYRVHKAKCNLQASRGDLDSVVTQTLNFRLSHRGELNRSISRHSR